MPSARRAAKVAAPVTSSPMAGRECKGRTVSTSVSSGPPYDAVRRMRARRIATAWRLATRPNSPCVLIENRRQPAFRGRDRHARRRLGLRHRSRPLFLLVLLAALERARRPAASAAFAGHDTPATGVERESRHHRDEADGGRGVGQRQGGMTAPDQHRCPHSVRLQTPVPPGRHGQSEPLLQVIDRLNPLMKPEHDSVATSDTQASSRDASMPWGQLDARRSSSALPRLSEMHASRDA